MAAWASESRTDEAAVTLCASLLLLHLSYSYSTFNYHFYLLLFFLAVVAARASWIPRAAVAGWARATQSPLGASDKALSSARKAANAASGLSAETWGEHRALRCADYGR